MTNTLHAHVSTAAADCDGPVYDSYVETFNYAEREAQVRAYFNGLMRGYDEPVNDFSDIDFMNRVFASKCGPYAVHQMRVTVDESGFDYHEQTEEGYRSGEVRWCRDETCDRTRRTHRDVFAEAAGY